MTRSDATGLRRGPCARFAAVPAAVLALAVATSPAWAQVPVVSSAPVALKDVLAVVGGLLGVTAFFWRVWEAAYTHLSLDIELDERSRGELRYVTAGLSVENKAIAPKRIDYAALIVSPAEMPLEMVCDGYAAARGLPGGRRRASPSVFFDGRVAEVTRICDEIFVVPLPFFFAEQQRVGNEQIRFRCVLPIEARETPRQIIVRFMTFLRYEIAITRWRTSSDLMVI